MHPTGKRILFLFFLQPLLLTGYGQKKVLAFYTAQNDLAHISFVHEAHDWFEKTGRETGFTYDSTNDWRKLTTDTLKKYGLIIFLDTRPEAPEQRKAFERYMEEGGAWLGFHFSGFALTPSAYNQDWNWYHDRFLGSGQYVSNTWRPTAAVLRVEDRNHATTRSLPETFSSAPNEWYRWEKDLRKNQAIKILLSIDSSSFPLGTGPKLHEIWHSGDYPVAWTNTKYRMVYLNMGHNDMDYGGTNRTLSHTFGSENQNRFIRNVLQWLLTNK